MRKKSNAALAVGLVLIWSIYKVGQLAIALAKNSRPAYQYLFWLVKAFWSLLTQGIRDIYGGVLLVFKRLFLLQANSYIHSVKAIRSKIVPKKRGRKPNRRPIPIRAMLIRFGFVSTVGLLLVLTYSVVLVRFTHDLPSPNKLSQYQSPTTTEFFDRNGKLLYRLYEGRNRTVVSLADLPRDLINATVAVEDKHFFTHQGVDLQGIARAAWVYVNDHQIQGGSTITQQLIKNTLLTPERTWDRKFKEIFLALWAETIYTKQQILEMYFNDSPYGGPAWGIEAAAQTYFKKHAHDLTLAESAYLAGLPASPTTYSPYGVSPTKGLERQREVLRRMLDQGYITPGQYQTAVDENLNFVDPINSIKAPHFVMYLRGVLADKYGEAAVAQGGLKITTTLDLDVQEMAEQVLTDELSKLTTLNVSNGAVMVMDPKTGQILAMVGSRNYDDPKIGNFNVAVAPRQPGSSIKPITYATAFKQGYSPGNVLLDTPTTFSNQWERYSPVNYDGRYHGAVTIRTALGSSYNVPAVKMLALVGIPNMIATAKDLGITTFDDSDRFGLSLTLGGGEVKLIDMMGAYSTFANNGIHHQPEGVLKIVDSFGETLEDNSTVDGNRALPLAVAYLINNILADNNARTPAFGPNSLLKIPGHTVAVKTGTTDLKRDNWTFGYTPSVVVGVWVGNNDNTPMDPRLSSGITGAAPIWSRIMTTLLADSPDVAFARPPEVIDMLVDGRKDLGISGQPAKSVVALNRQKEKDGDKEKETITFTDPFSRGNLVPVNIQTNH